MSLYVDVKDILEREFSRIESERREESKFSYDRLKEIVETGWENRAIPCCLAKTIDPAVRKVDEILKQKGLFDGLVDRYQPGGGCYDSFYHYIVFKRGTSFDSQVEIHRSDATRPSLYDIVNPKLWGFPRDGFFFQVQGRPFKYIPEDQARFNSDIPVLSYASSIKGGTYEFLIFRNRTRLQFGSRAKLPGYLISNSHPSRIDVNDRNSYISVTSYLYGGNMFSSPEDEARSLFHMSYWTKGVLDLIKEGVLCWIEPSIKRPKSQPKKDIEATIMKRNIALINNHARAS